MYARKGKTKGKGKGGKRFYNANVKLILALLVPFSNLVVAVLFLDSQRTGNSNSSKNI